MIKKYFLWNLSFLIILLSAYGCYAQENPQDIAKTERIIKAYEVGDKIWYQNSKGVVSKYDLVSGKILKPFSETVFVDLATYNDKLIGLKRPVDSEQPHYFLINILSGESVGPKLTLLDDIPLAITANTNFAYVLSRKSISILDKRNKTPKWKSRKLLEPIQYAPQMSAVVTKSGLVYFGRNQGEWGGGLRSIDPETGVVKIIQQKKSGDCGDLLFPNCDPVPSIILDPSDSNCVIAAMGLSHFFTRGAIVTVCDGKITDVYRKSKTKTYKGGREYTYELPFFDIVETQKGWLAATYGEYVKYSSGIDKATPYPEFPTRKGISYVRLDNEFIIITSDVNWGMSLSGTTPLLVRKIRKP